MPGFVAAVPKPARATDWVNAVDTSGLGTSIVSSAAMQLANGSLPALADNFLVEIQFTLTRDAGSGHVSAWAVLERTRVDGATATPDETTPHWYSSPLYAQPGPESHIVRVKPIVSIPRANAAGGLGNLILKVEAKGSAADTDWTCSGIRARLVYQPL